MKNTIFHFLVLVAVLAMSAHNHVHGQKPQAESPSRLRTQIQAANQTAALAAEAINNNLNKDAGGENVRRVVARIVTSRTTQDGVQIYELDGQMVCYHPSFNSFVPVRTRQQALRIATGEFEAKDDEAGERLNKGKPDKKGKDADINLGVMEDRRKIKLKEEDEDTLIN